MNQTNQTNRVENELNMHFKQFYQSISNNPALGASKKFVKGQINLLEKLEANFKAQGNLTDFEQASLVTMAAHRQSLEKKIGYNRHAQTAKKLAGKTIDLTLKGSEQVGRWLKGPAASTAFNLLRRPPILLPLAAVSWAFLKVLGYGLQWGSQLTQFAKKVMTKKQHAANNLNQPVQQGNTGHRRHNVQGQSQNQGQDPVQKQQGQQPPKPGDTTAKQQLPPSDGPNRQIQSSLQHNVAAVGRHHQRIVRIDPDHGRSHGHHR